MEMSAVQANFHVLAVICLSQTFTTRYKSITIYLPSRGSRLPQSSCPQLWNSTCLIASFPR